MKINGFEFEEESMAGGHKSPESQHASDNSRHVRVLKSRLRTAGTSDQGRYNGLKALLGYARVLGGGNAPIVKYLSRTIPACYPGVVDADLNPNGTPFEWCTSVPKVEPMAKVSANTDAGVAGVTPTYDALRFTAEYNVLPYNIFDDNAALALTSSVPKGNPTLGVSGTDYPTALPHEGLLLQHYSWNSSRYIARYIRPAPTTIVVRQSFLLFNGTGAKATTSTTTKSAYQPASAIPAGIPIPQYREYVKYVWMNVPYAAIPRSYMAKCTNKTNKYIFDGYAPGTLLYASSDIDPGFSPLGYRTVNLTHNCIYKPNVSGLLSVSSSGTVTIYGDIAMGWNSDPFVDTLTKQFFYWPMSASGEDIGPPILTQNGEFATQARLFNGTEPFAPVDFAPLFAPEMSSF